MPFKKKDWEQMLRRLQKARAQLAQAREAKKKGDDATMLVGLGARLRQMARADELIGGRAI